MNIELLKQLKKDTDAAIKAENDYAKKSERCRAMGIDCTERQRTKASAALNDAAVDRHRAEDNIKATLVDLGFINAEPDEYEARQIERDNGGMTQQLRYAPRKPQALQK